MSARACAREGERGGGERGVEKGGERVKEGKGV